MSRKKNVYFPEKLYITVVKSKISNSGQKLLEKECSSSNRTEKISGSGTSATIPPGEFVKTQTAESFPQNLMQ